MRTEQLDALRIKMRLSTPGILHYLPLQSVVITWIAREIGVLTLFGGDSGQPVLAWLVCLPYDQTGICPRLRTRHRSVITRMHVGTELTGAILCRIEDYLPDLGWLD